MSRPVHVAFILSILLTGWPGPPLVIAQPAVAAEPPLLKHPSLAELGKLYQSLDLPLPPKEVGFAIMGNGLLPWQVSRYNPNPDSPNSLSSNFRFRFASEDAKVSGQYFVWRAFYVNPEKCVVKFQRVAPSPEMVLQVMKMNRLDASDHWSSDTESIFAIQCHLLGHNELAAFFYRRSQKWSPLPLDRLLLIDAWNHWVGQLGNQAVDRTIPVKKLKSLVNQYHIFQPSEPELSDYRGNPEDAEHSLFRSQQAFLNQLDLTLKPVYGGRANSGSAESLIDELVHAIPAEDSNEFSRSESDLWDRKNQIRKWRHHKPSLFSFNRSETERKLALLGFDAVPVLIEHVEDQRFTRHSFGSLVFAGPPPSRWHLQRSYFQRVGDRARHILSAFIDLSKEGVNDEWKIKKNDYLAAWKPLSKMKEADFVAKTISSQKELNEHFLFFLTAKYPEQAIALYKKLLSDPEEAGCFPDLVSFIIDSPLPKSEKLALLSEGIKHKSPTYQARALEGLLELDHSVFTSHCLTSLSRFPKEFAKDQVAWHHVAFVELGLCSEDLSARKLVDEAGKKLPVPARIAMLSSVGGAHYRPKKNLTLAFMAGFLNDREVYVYHEKHSRGDLESAFQGFERIEVRNYAADQILGVLGIELPLDDKTSEDEWKKVRDFVKDEVERRLELEKAK